MYVAYATRVIDTSWVPRSADIVVVHNDDRLDRDAPGLRDARHVDAGDNIGFGAAVNRALPFVVTDRVILCNPDVWLTRPHWDALADADADELVTVPLVDEHGVPTTVTSGYPTPIAHLASGYRLGRFARRGGRSRSTATRLLGAWGRDHTKSLDAPVGSWPLTERWVSGAVLSVDTERLGRIDGFDERYFLYYEDVDLCRRFVSRYPLARARVADVPWGHHAVGGSAHGVGGRSVERVRLESAIRWARSQPGAAWQITADVLAARRMLMRGPA